MQSHKLDMKSDMKSDIKSDIKSTLPSICCTLYAQASQPSNQVVFEIEIVGNLDEKSLAFSEMPTATRRATAL